jgi:hypothetical protein
MDARRGRATSCTDRLENGPSFDRPEIKTHGVSHTQATGHVRAPGLDTWRYAKGRAKKAFEARGNRRKLPHRFRTGRRRQPGNRVTTCRDSRRLILTDSSGSDERDSVEKIIATNARPWNSFWSWRDKPVGERGAAEKILLAAGLKVKNLVSRRTGEDPPDCEAMVDEGWSGIEVTELVHQKTLARSLKAVKERAVGKEPDRPEAHFVWEKDDLISMLQVQIDRKDNAKLRGGPYKRYILIIHTDEFFLDSGSVKRFLEGAAFRATMITDVILGLSYEPKLGDCPIFRLPLARP